MNSRIYSPELFEREVQRYKRDQNYIWKFLKKLKIIGTNINPTTPFVTINKIIV